MILPFAFLLTTVRSARQSVALLRARYGSERDHYLALQARDPNEENAVTVAARDAAHKAEGQLNAALWYWPFRMRTERSDAVPGMRYRPDPAPAPRPLPPAPAAP